MAYRNDASFAAVAHPSATRDLKATTSRERWKAADHARRWANRYGKPYPEMKGEVGVCDGVIFKERGNR